MRHSALVGGTIVGGIVLHLTGYLIFEMAFSDFYAANAGTATGVPREPNIWWAIIVGELGYAALITYVFEVQPGTLSIGKGIITGAIVGGLIWFSVDFIFYGLNNVSNLPRPIVDPVLEFIHGGIAGAVIAPVLAKMSRPGSSAGE